MFDISYIDGRDYSLNLFYFLFYVILVVSLDALVIVYTYQDVVLELLMQNVVSQKFHSVHTEFLQHFTRSCSGMVSRCS